MEILGTNRLIPKGFELGTTMGWPNRCIQAPKGFSSWGHELIPLFLLIDNSLAISFFHWGAGMAQW